LSADFGNLQKDVESICSADCDYVHIDVMDGHFVPNLTIGPVVVNSIAKASTKPLDIHLMVKNNDFFIDMFSHLDIEFISFHLEGENNPHRVIQKIKNLGFKASIALNPHTNPDSIKYLLEDLDMVLLMSVNPGFGGQSYIDITNKVIELKKLIDNSNRDILIEVDGGINEQNIKELKKAGVDIAVSGSYIFKNKSYKDAIDSLRV
jgi:ribulose-phosphate 3-epimerase